jgi:tetratricopeptide (TPR) repeat protein
MSLNAVERRLAYLCGEWLGFRDNGQARMLVWQVPDNAFRLVECFVEAQKQESAYGSGDLFIVFKSPFEHAIQYSRALKEALRGQYDASKADLAAEGLPTDWAFDPSATASTPARFFEAVRSFGSKYQQSLGHVGIVLMPSDVGDEQGFVNWLSQALNCNLPERIRLLLVDSIAHPHLPSLSASDDPRIVVSRPQVDGLTLAQETFAQEPVKGPAGVFRNLLMGAVTLAEKGSADQVRAKAKDALDFARRQHWPDQEVVLWLLVAGALLKESRHEESVQVYQGARRVATRVAEENHPAGNKLLLQTWFGEAGAHLAKGDAEAAAGCYDAAAVVAQHDKNVILAIEAYRMAGFSRARLGDIDGALERGRCAFALGDQLRPDARAMTTLGYVAVDAMRALDKPRVETLERLKSEWSVRSRSATENLERQVAALGDGLTVSHERQLVERHGADQDRLKADIDSRIDEVVGGADQRFRQWFDLGRSALGPEWPMFSATGLIATPQGGSNP